ncbi:putative wall-associated receptor kinase-like 16 [Hibiscus syriacus]|uniref:putative wall-associated receptor kinase-like 16 n=1 Tax=Hibiscus syriacus TaxID=106335 RepID=UPI001920C2A4|nr:putative wall-associated receptor kinase-like 16 [Hibiscus syriacus]
MKLPLNVWPPWKNILKHRSISAYNLGNTVMNLIRSVVVLQVMILLNVILTVKASTPPMAKPGCQSSCGDVIIPFPFGSGGECNITEEFFITCDTNFVPNKPFLTNSNIEVLNISLDGQLRILSNSSYDCYNTSGDREWFYQWLQLSEFSINSNKNKFTAIGCDTYARVEGFLGQRYATGCLSLCNNITDVSSGSCSGIGCCQTSIPKDVRSYNITLESYDNHVAVLPENPCSYAFVAETDNYTFSSSDIRGFDFQDRRFPVTLDWNIGDTSCDEAKTDTVKFACRENSACVDSESNSGYFCKCFDGYMGNPYLPGGCQDINECEAMNPCNGTARCFNLLGTYNCSCPVGYEGDGRKNGTGCSLPEKRRSNRSPLIDVALGTSIGFLGLILGIVLVYWVLRQRQITKLREEYFQQNGGILLREQLSIRQGYREDVKIFAAEELENATNNYHESRILGQGGQGTVYKGILADNRTVAIKKSIIGDPSQVEQFINELMVLCQINHRNVVKLLGCCLETQVPLLVYEYITNGTLFHHLHNDDDVSYLPWETRLRIATETAEALSYLHSAASVPIIHRDIKLANILLDDNYTAKVSDFGASRLIPSDQAQITTIVQGTFGYLDPEYMHTSLLTGKSDVYSFGVVLIELLTGQKVVCFKRSEEKRVLAMYFVSLMKEDRLVEILDHRVVNDENIEVLKEVAALARRCVRVKGEERPTMKEVAHELAGMKAMPKHPWSGSKLTGEEAEYLLGDLISTYNDGATSSSMGYDSINNKITFELDGAR